MQCNLNAFQGSARVVLRLDAEWPMDHVPMFDFACFPGDGCCRGEAFREPMSDHCDPYEALDRLLSLRVQIETFAARHAALATAAGASVEGLRQAFGCLRSAVWQQDAPRLAEADEALHRAMIELAGVPTLGEVWRVVWEALRAFHDMSLRRHWPDLRSLEEEHAHLVDAIASGDPEVAEDAARGHLEAVRYRMAQSGESQANGPDPVQRTVAYLAFNLHRPLRLRHLAREVAFACPGHLSRLFRQRYGFGFRQYVQRVRMERAAKLLRTSRLPVRDIAACVGYADVSRFAQHFRRSFQTTPLRYRQGR